MVENICRIYWSRKLKYNSYIRICKKEEKVVQRSGLCSVYVRQMSKFLFKITVENTFDVTSINA